MKWEFKHPSIKRVGLLHSEDVFNLQIKKTLPWDDSDGKESAWNAGDLGSILGLGRSTGEGNSNPLQYASLEIPMDRGAWHATVHGVTKSQTQLSDCTFTFSCAIDRELDWKLQSPAPIFGKHDFPSKMFLSFISVSAQWLPLPVTPSACTCLSVFIHCDTIYACGHILALVYSLPKKIIIIVTEFKSFKSISVISWYCGKPCTSFFWSFLLLLLLGFCFFFFHSVIFYTILRVKGGVLVWKVCFVYLSLWRWAFAQFPWADLVYPFVFSYIVFGSGQGVHNSHHLGQWKDDSRSLWRVEAFLSTSVGNLILCLLNPICQSDLYTYLQISDVILASILKLCLS